MELYELGIRQAQEGLAKGEFSSRDIVESIIARYEAKNAEIATANTPHIHLLRMILLN